MSKKELKKILFVDDDEDILLVAEYCLKVLNVEAKFLTSGEEAVKEAPLFQPDLIFLDVLMPQMDGVSTLKAIKQLSSLSQTPIVFLTAKSQKDEIEEFFRLGVIDVITKPFDPLTFASSVKKIWKKCP